MVYEHHNLGDYSGLGAIWGRGPLPALKVKTKDGVIFLPPRINYYYEGPYIGQRPPPPLFGTSYWGAARSPVTSYYEEEPLEFWLRPSIALPALSMYRAWDKLTGRTKVIQV